MGDVKNTSSKTPDIKERFKPNREFYFWLFICALVLMLLCLDISEENGQMFRIATGLSCECVASVLVAWLIDEANCKRDAQEADNNYRIIFKRLYFVFDADLQIIIHDTAHFIQDDTPRKWHDWIVCAYHQIEKDPSVIPAYNQYLMQFFDAIAEQVIMILGQEAVLLQMGVICEKDIQALRGILSYCELSRTVFRSKSTEEFVSKRFQTNLNLMRATIAYSPSLRPINDILIEPTLYRLALEADQEAEEQIKASENSTSTPSIARFESEPTRESKV